MDTATVKMEETVRYAGTYGDTKPLIRHTKPKVRRTDEVKIIKSEEEHVGLKPLKSYTIPKIRRTADVYLVHCLTDRQEYKDIHNSLNEARLDMDSELKCQFGETKLIFNHYLETKFSAKRSEMREKNEKENFCFLVMSNRVAWDICRNGLHVDGKAFGGLGNPQWGVYLFRHSDVAINFYLQMNPKSNIIMIFKVLLGRIRKVQAVVNSEKKEVMDPNPNFDTYISKKVPSLKDSYDEQIANSLIYFYEFDNAFKPVETPRQCLPFALITFRFLG